jgi:hypothetical protein
MVYISSILPGTTNHTAPWMTAFTMPSTCWPQHLIFPYMNVQKYVQNVTNVLLWIGMNNTDFHQTSIEWCSQITVTRTNFLRTSSVCLTCRETLPNCQKNWSSFFVCLCSCMVTSFCSSVLSCYGLQPYHSSWLSFHLTLHSTTSIIQIKSLNKPHKQ